MSSGIVSEMSELLEEKGKRGRLPQGAPAVQFKEEALNFYSSVDKNAHGRLSSPYPAWYFSRSVSDLTDEIRSMERAINLGGIEPRAMVNYKAQLQGKKERLDKIEASCPKMNGKQKDQLVQEIKELGQKIGEAMFSLSDMKFGNDFADPHEEARRSEEPCIKLSPYQIGLARMMELGYSESTGEICRRNAEIIWKVGRKTLGENSDSSILRPRDVHRV